MVVGDDTPPPSTDAVNDVRQAGRSQNWEMGVHLLGHGNMKGGTDSYASVSCEIIEGDNQK